MLRLPTVPKGLRCPLNVLFILVDDLRSELGCYGVGYARTPNIDLFAASGTVFNRACAAVALCAPSRDSLLTGLRPANAGFYNIPDGPHWHRNPVHIALPRLFKENGYAVSNVGKMLNTLSSNGFAENTVVVLCGDHGWHLGDLGIWGKHKTFEFATRAPLIVRLPCPKRFGGKTDALVELLNILLGRSL